MRCTFAIKRKVAPTVNFTTEKLFVSLIRKKMFNTFIIFFFFFYYFYYFHLQNSFHYFSITFFWERNKNAEIDRIIYKDQKKLWFGIGNKWKKFFEFDSNLLFGFWILKNAKNCRKICWSYGLKNYNELFVIFGNEQTMLECKIRYKKN